MGFGCCLQKGPTNGRQRAVISSKSLHQRAKTRCLRDQLNSSGAHHHQLHHQLCIARDKFAFKGDRFSALADDFYCSTIGCRRRASAINGKWAPMQNVPQTSAKASLFINFSMTKMRIFVLGHNSVVVAVIYVDIQ